MTSKSHERLGFKEITTKTALLSVFFISVLWHQANASSARETERNSATTKYAELKVQFKAAGLPELSTLKQWWIGRCFKQETPNEPASSVAVPVSNRGDLYGPGFDTCQGSYPAPKGFAIVLPATSLRRTDGIETDPRKQADIRRVVNEAEIIYHCQDSRTLTTTVSHFSIRNLEHYKIRQSGSFLFARIGENDEMYCYYYKKTNITK